MAKQKSSKDKLEPLAGIPPAIPVEPKDVSLDTPVIQPALKLGRPAKRPSYSKKSPPPYYTEIQY